MAHVTGGWCYYDKRSLVCIGKILRNVWLICSFINAIFLCLHFICRCRQMKCLPALVIAVTAVSITFLIIINTSSANMYFSINIVCIIVGYWNYCYLIFLLHFFVSHSHPTLQLLIIICWWHYDIREFVVFHRNWYEWKNWQLSTKWPHPLGRSVHLCSHSWGIHNIAVWTQTPPDPRALPPPSRHRAFLSGAPSPGPTPSPCKLSYFLSLYLLQAKFAQYHMAVWNWNCALLSKEGFYF